MPKATALSHPNIAFIKYWGNRDNERNLPVNGSISMNLGGLETRTTVNFLPELTSDELILNRKQAIGTPLYRISRLLDRYREFDRNIGYARVESTNNFPLGAGIASSASAFSSLALAANESSGLELPLPTVMAISRHSSGSAVRSFVDGYGEWLCEFSVGEPEAISLAPSNHWHLIDFVVVMDESHKEVSSSEGHPSAASSPLQQARVDDASRRLDFCRAAILNKDFESLAEIAELDSNMMHAVMQTSNPRLMYWQSGTLEVMRQVTAARGNGLPVFYTIDAGPNVHAICLPSYQGKVLSILKDIPSVKDVLVAHTGGPAHLVTY